LAKISTDIKKDLEAYKKEYFANKQVMESGGKGRALSSKQRYQRHQKAERREERHRAMRQGIHDMIHEQVNLIKQIEINLKNITTDSIKLKFENMVQKKIETIENLGKNLVEQEK
jgi:hypothetical protein